MIKKVKLLAIASIICTSLFMRDIVKAANFTDNQNVETNKTWTIKFTGEVGFDDLTRQGITVINTKGTLENVGIQLGQDKKTVTIAPPQGGYIPGESYILIIGTNTHSKTGKALKKNYTLKFSIKGSYVVTFNKNLEQAIRNKINKPTGDIYKSDVENITYLDASNKGITDISGMENLTNLQILDLSQNQISDISELKDLSKLSYLRLDNNQISDISALKGLTNLNLLSLKSNRISNISTLKWLTNLNLLYLAKNQISDYSPVKEYYNNLMSKDFELLDTTDNVVTFKDKNLEKAVRIKINKTTGDIYKSDVEKISSLQVYDNGIQYISGIENLTNLQLLDLSENQISDINSLKALTKLQTLLLSKNQISDISSLQDLTNLQKVYLDNNRISDISGLEWLANLQELYLDYNRISDISKLEWLTNLKALHLAQNHISDYSPVKGYYDNLTDKDFKMSDVTIPKETVVFKDENLEQSVRNKIKKPTGDIYKEDVKNIISLDASSKGIKDISGIEDLINLQTFDLSHNQIKDISVLNALTNLRTLNLSYNEISDISKLRGISNLETLNLNNNQISDISAIQGLNNLKALNLSNNKIRNISPLKGLTDLQTLWLNNNKISDADKESLKDILSNCNIYYDSSF